MSSIRNRWNAWFDRWSVIAASINDGRDPADCLGGYLT